MPAPPLTNDDALRTWLETTLAAIEGKIDDMQQSLDTQLAALEAMINDTNANITEIDNKIAAIDSTLDELAKLDDIIDKLDALNRSLADAEDELAKTMEVASDEEKSKIDTQTILLVLILVVVILSFLMNVMGGKRQGKSALTRDENEAAVAEKRVITEERAGPPSSRFRKS